MAELKKKKYFDYKILINFSYNMMWYILSSFRKLKMKKWKNEKSRKKWHVRESCQNLVVKKLFSFFKFIVCNSMQLWEF